MTAKLIVTPIEGDPSSTTEVDIDRDVVTLGRGMGNDVILDDPMMRISRRHAQIEREGKGYVLRDLKSRNGTLLDGQRVEADTPVAIREGQPIHLGGFEVRLVTGEGSGGETTVLEMEAPLHPAAIAEDLCDLYARRLGDDPEVRLEAIREVLLGALESATPDEARALFAQIRARFDPKEEQARLTLIRQRDARIRKMEALYRAGQDEFRRLSKEFLGEKGFESPKDVERFSRLIGQTLEVAFEWISKSLQGRKEFEDQADAQVSMIFARAENPVKDAGTPREIGSYLLDWGSDREPDATRGVLEEAFRDLTMHQLGLLAGVRECLHGVLQRIDPKEIEGRVQAKTKGGLAKQAWQKYCADYAEMFEEQGKVFNDLIFPSIRKGYLSLHAEPGKEEAGG
jgi:FHA domain-containing protein